MTEIVRFFVAGPFAPWSSPELGTGTRKNGTRYRYTTGSKGLQAWQLTVNLAARMAMRGRKPITGPALLRLEFTVKGSPELHGRPWVPSVRWSTAKLCWVKLHPGRPIPDLTNLVKGTEDACNSVLFGDDAQIAVSQSSRLYGPQEGVTISLHTFEAGEFATAITAAGGASDGPTAPAPLACAD